MSAAQDAVRALMAQGLTQRQIGAAIGRDQSYISRVARGVTPGDRVGPALADLAAGRVASAPAKRGGGSVPSTSWVSGGEVLIGHRGAAGVRSTLAGVSRSGGRVALVVRGTRSDNGAPFKLDPWGRGGIAADTLRRLLDEQLEADGVNPRRASTEDVSRALAGLLSEVRVGGDVAGSKLPAGSLVESVSVESLGA